MTRSEAPNSIASESNRTLVGEGISPGLAIGRAWIYRGATDPERRGRRIDRSQVSFEHERIERAVEQVLDDLQRSADRVKQELNQNLASIFCAHQAILTSPGLLGELRDGLETELVEAEEIVHRVLRRWEGRFAEDPGGPTARYSDDLADLRGRLLQALGGAPAHPLETIPDGSVVVASRLLPSDTVHLSRRSVVAVVAAQAGRGSHASLMTSERGIPAVAQLPNLLRQVDAGDRLLVDGTAGTVVLRPEEECARRFRKRIAGQRASEAAIRRRSREPAATRDGMRIEVAANVGIPDDVAAAVENGADGIGLFRLESLLMASDELPSDTQLLADLRAALKPIAAKPVTLRLLDAGGDKPVPWLDLPDEGNPFLGRRGLRLLFHHPQLLESQLRVFFRLSREHDIRILVPMITLAEEMQRVRQWAERIARELGLGRVPPLGAMIETPAAALCAAEIAVHADFLNLGTNDLTQYTMAADRENSAASHYFRDDHPALFKLLKIVCDQAGDTPVSMCGELAARPAVVPRLLDLGIRGLSVAPPLVPQVKEAVRQHRLEPNGCRPRIGQGESPR